MMGSRFVRVDPVFVIGAPRSGTSALSWALAQHSSLTTGPETDFLYYLLHGGPKACLRRAYQWGLERTDGFQGEWLHSHDSGWSGVLKHILRAGVRRQLWDMRRKRSRQKEDLKRQWLQEYDVSWSEYLEAVGLGFCALFASRSGDQRWVDSTPLYTLVSEDLAMMFPASRFVHVLRDGRAVVSSMVASGFPAKFARSFPNACRAWVAHALQGHAFCEAHPEKAVEIRSEEWLADPQSVMGSLLQWLGLEHEEGPAVFLDTRRINSSFWDTESADVSSARKGGQREHAPWLAWSPRQKRVFTELAQDAMQQMAYEPVLD